MNDHQGLEILCQSLVQLIGIVDLRPDDTGCCCLVFDQNLMMQIRTVMEPPRLLLSGRLNTEPDPGQAELLLRANAWGLGSCDGWFALDEQGRICLQAALLMKELAANQVVARIEALLDTLELWSNRLTYRSRELKHQDSWQRI